MTLADLDRELAQFQSDARTISANLIALEQDPNRQLLEIAPLRGDERGPVARRRATRSRTSGRCRRRSTTSSTAVRRSGRTKQTLSAPREHEIHALLHTDAIELSASPIALADRDLLGSAHAMFALPRRRPRRSHAGRVRPGDRGDRGGRRGVGPAGATRRRSACHPRGNELRGPAPHVRRPPGARPRRVAPDGSRRRPPERSDLGHRGGRSRRRKRGRRARCRPPTRVRPPRCGGVTDRRSPRAHRRGPRVRRSDTDRARSGSHEDHGRRALGAGARQRSCRRGMGTRTGDDRRRILANWPQSPSSSGAGARTRPGRRRTRTSTPAANRSCSATSCAVASMRTSPKPPISA